MHRIFDCSNSNERPYHRGGGGPVTNDVMRYLHENARVYGCEFVSDLVLADVVITNDVFSHYVLKSGLPLIKRMDGVFWQDFLEVRNEKLNAAAELADHVVFISEYSHSSYIATGRKLKSSSVSLNWVDTDVFTRRTKYPSIPRRFVAVASDWSRPEKRLNAVLEFARMVPRVIMVGRIPDVNLPSSVISVGYIDDPTKLAIAIRECDAMVNFSYRDPAPKVVAQASASGLPVLYADSGGTRELVIAGARIPDPVRNTREIVVPELSDIETSLECMYRYYDNMIEFILRRRVDIKSRFRAMLDGYFLPIKRLSGV